MIQFASLAACLALVSSSAAPAQEELPETAQVTVLLLDAEGDPAPSEVIIVMPLAETRKEAPAMVQRAMTDETGKAKLEVPAETKMAFECLNVTHYHLGRVVLEPQRPDAIASVEMQLGLPTRSSVPLRFLDGESGSPIAGVVVSELESEFMYEVNEGFGPTLYGVTGSRGGVWTSDEDGRVDALLGTVGRWKDRGARVRIEAPGYATTIADWRCKEIPHGGVQELETVKLRRAELLELMVIDPPIGSELALQRRAQNSDLDASYLSVAAGATIEVPMGSFVDQRAMVEGVPGDGRLRLDVTLEGQLARTMELSVRAAQERAGAPRLMAVDLWEAGQIAGRVVTRSGAPLEGYLVAVDREVSLRERKTMRKQRHAMRSVAVTGPTGRFTIRGLPEGTYSASVCADPKRRGSDDLADPIQVEVSRDTQTLTHRFVAVPELTTTGIILDAEGRPCEGVILGADESYRPAHASSNQNRTVGAFEFGPRPPGLLSIRYDAEQKPEDGKFRRKVETRVHAGARNLRFAVGPVASVKGYAARDAEAGPVRATFILQEEASGVQRYPKVELSRTFRFDAAPIGVHRLWAFTEDGWFARPKKVGVGGSDIEELSIELEEGARVEIDASRLDRHLRCQIELPGGESLERILAGTEPTVIVPAGHVKLVLSEIDGAFSEEWSLSLVPGETVQRIAAAREDDEPSGDR